MCYEFRGKEYRYRKEKWTKGGTNGTCVIWSKVFPFWHLLTGVVGLKLSGIWGEGGMWRCQVNIWQPEIACKDSERDTNKTCWNAY